MYIIIARSDSAVDRLKFYSAVSWFILRTVHHYNYEGNVECMARTKYMFNEATPAM